MVQHFLIVQILRSIQLVQLVLDYLAFHRYRPYPEVQMNRTCPVLHVPLDDRLDQCHHVIQGYRRNRLDQLFQRHHVSPGDQGYRHFLFGKECLLIITKLLNRVCVLGMGAKSSRRGNPPRPVDKSTRPIPSVYSRYNLARSREYNRMRITIIRAVSG